MNELYKRVKKELKEEGYSIEFNWKDKRKVGFRRKLFLSCIKDLSKLDEIIIRSMFNKVYKRNFIEIRMWNSYWIKVIVREN